MELSLTSCPPFSSSCLPDWASELPRIFPFLFPFETRFSFLNLTSFGYARLIQKWQSQQERGNDHRTDDALGFLSRLPRQKVRISRNHLLESAVKVFELYGTTSSILEIEYFEEVGTGLGPTLEFYAIASKEFGRRDLRLWRDADSVGGGEYVHRPQGFFPAPAAADDEVFVGTSRVKFFRILGQFVAKALLDSRIIDMAFNPVFLRHVLSDAIEPSIQLLRVRLPPPSPSRPWAPPRLTPPPLPSLLTARRRPVGQVARPCPAVCRRKAEHPLRRRGDRGREAGSL